MIFDKILSLKIGFIDSFGYLLVFLATFFESFPLFGLFVPGATIIFIAGFLSKLGFVSVWLVMILAILGAILGDTAGYLFGRYFGKEFLQKNSKYLLIRREYAEKAGCVVCGHTGKSLVFGRISPVTRSAAPFIAGTEKVNFLKFMFFNIIGGAIWGFLFVYLGYLFGQSYQATENVERWLLISTLGVIVIFYTYYFYKILLDKREYKKIQRVGECVANWD